ncbi:flagellar motor switch protein FliN [Thalassoglobus polymorphus]|uniref:Flagellar motor switch protein FliN n=1 Tax=Thalassoglobus polymorphus TaxID=2527994 RepID=A0A517QPQ4_9PLAN|nr:flagellar motor switch protein FliN [Thalassoglobus polymorphus]QDT33577.1 Flagellar motor switch protein FliN [Thalassoglobus polymorphus]
MTDQQQFDENIKKGSVDSTGATDPVQRDGDLSASQDYGDRETEDKTEQVVYSVDFPAAVPPSTPPANLPLQRFYDVNVTVSVELGRTELPLGELLQLGPTAVVELNRSVSEMVDVMAQGIRIARGEVVVVEDRYAVRLTHIENSHSRGAEQ